MESPGQWLDKALVDLCKKIETGLDLDGEIISGLVSYCELASPLDAKEYLDNIIGQEVGKSVIEEYLKKRGYSDISYNHQNAPVSKLHAYYKPSSSEDLIGGAKKTSKGPKEAVVSNNKGSMATSHTMESQASNKGNQGNLRKKKGGKVVSLAEAAKGSIVFQKGKPCSCQARRHRLISNCLSCGKIVCEQEGEGPCNFCGALVLKEGSAYAGLDEGVVPPSDTEAVAEAYAKRLVEYDRNSAARTTVIDDQSDYYEIDGDNWMSMEEKELIRKKKEEIEEAERSRRSKLVMTFDLVGRKVLMNEDEISEELEKGILFRPSAEKETNRIKPNPTIKVQPIFMDVGRRKTTKESTSNKGSSAGLCLEISGRVQHENNELNVL